MFNVSIEFTLPCGCVMSYRVAHDYAVDAASWARGVDHSAEVLKLWLTVGPARHICPPKGAAP